MAANTTMDSTRFLVENPRDSSNTLTVVGDDTGLRIAVADEKAVDSYNQEFECDIDLTIEQSLALRDWLLSLYPVKSTVR